MIHGIVRPPFVTPNWSPSAEHNRGISSGGSAVRVLIIEDEALLAMDMEESLSQAGFEIVGTAEGEREAIALVNRLRPDLVLVDISLRDGDGIAAAKVIGEQAMIIFVSASSDPATLSAAQALSPLGFIQKPYAGHELADMVKRMLELKDGP